LKNFEVRRILYKQVDILVDQLIYTGYALNALEGMSSGLPVISNIEDEVYTLPFRRWSYLDECPIISASPETIVDTLRKLVTRPKLRHQIGSAGRKYVEKYHSYEASQYLFGEVIRYLYGDRESLINLYHPILGEFSKQEPLVDHPLVNSHIVD
jgi:glycosyltransferase involved in cell wall biosynthesis